MLTFVCYLANQHPCSTLLILVYFFIRFGIIIFVVSWALTRPWINSTLLSSFNFVISHWVSLDFRFWSITTMWKTYEFQCLNHQPLQLGKKFDSKFLLLMFASSKAFWWQKFSCLFLLAACVHDWIILHSYVEKHIFGKKTFYWPTCI